MRTIKLLIFISVLAAMAGTAGAAVILQENFEGLTANATLHGQNGWTHDPAYENPAGVPDPLSIRSSSPDEAWVIDTSSAGQLTYTSPDASIVLSGGDRALQVSKHYNQGEGDPHVTKASHNVAWKDIADYPASTGELDTAVYFSILIQSGAGVSGSDNAFVAMIGETATGNNPGQVAMGNMSYNDGAWHHGLGGWVYNSSSYATGWSEGTEDQNVHLLVGKLEKDWQWHTDTETYPDTTDDRAYFTKLHIWVDPNAGDSASPDGLSKYKDNKLRWHDHISELVFNAENGMNGGDMIYFDNLVIGETWGDVIPEPATMTLLAFGSLALLRRKK